MSIKTTKLELIKPELTDTADITATNENWDKLDKALLTNDDGAIPEPLKFEKGLVTGETIKSDTPITDNIGTPEVPFGSMYAKHYNLYSYENIKAGEMSVHVTGTTSTKGEAVIGAGNELKEGVKGNSRGRVRLYGTDSGYIDVISGNEGAENYEIHLPNGNGTLALEGNTCKIATGEYTGGGKHSSTTPNTLSFPFTPKVVMISCNDTDCSGVPWIYGNKYGQIVDVASNNIYCKLTWTTDGLSWYEGSNHTGWKQLDSSGKTYRWVAIG
jgi:hypothetical protein